MRLADLAPQTGAPADPRQLRARMSELAARFPGALRETDELTLDAIDCRIAALDAVAGQRGEALPWMEAVALFHALTRGALVAKRWLNGRKQVDDGHAALFARDLQALPFPEDSRAWACDLARVASPPRGRLLDLVFTRLARQLAVPEADARALVFGAGRRARGR